MRKTLFRLNSRGFTAVEIAMVASVIAILALLILPIFRQRAEEARIAAVEDELASLVKALLLVEADMPGGGFLVQLNDLDNRSNPSFDPLTDPLTPDLDPPRSRWNSAIGEFEYIASNDARYRTLIQNWKGPYTAYKNTIPMSQVPTVLETSGAVIIPPFTPAELDADRYPVDPWGSPYLLFGPEETIYNVRVLYSMGPNGVPADLANPATADYNRRGGALGAGDDFSFTF